MVATVISVVALVASFATLYFQFLHKRDAAVCTLVASEVKRELITVQLIISNPGTRPILLKDARLMLRIPVKIGGGIGATYYDPLDHHNLKSGPFSIPRDGLVSVALTLPVSSPLMECVASWADNENFAGWNGDWPIYARLNFVTVGGKRINSEESILTVQWHSDGYGWTPREPSTWRIGDWELEAGRVI